MRTERRPRKAVVFAALMGLSVVLLLLPRPWTGWMRGLLEPLSWIQALFSAGGRIASEGMDRVSSDAAAERERELLEQVEALQRQSLHQVVTIQELQERLAVVSGVREQLRSEQAKIILARVVSSDPDPQRDSIRISAGSATSEIKVGDYVAAAPATGDPAASPREALLRQGFIGEVVQVQPFVSTVRLATDRAFGPARVRLAKPLPDGKWQISDREALLFGRGRGQMEVSRASENFAAQGYERVVMTIGGTTGVALTVGLVEAALSVRESPLHFNLSIRPWIDPRELSDVYVLSLPQ